ncbi:MAG: cysteine desulfurase family protein [Acholeplasmataceae bacterium]|nr:cysteine desulfurase family protein [Acholeplasmataceae bacterium]
MKKIYLDHAATTPLNPVALNKMLPFFNELYGNPSSVHEMGASSKKAINEARKKVASLLNCKPTEIFFTSSGTEATNWAILGYSEKNPSKKEIIITTIEHHATLHACEYLEKKGYKIHALDVDHEGFLSIEQLKKTINSNTLMVSIIWGNNEIGTIQNLEEIQKICKKHHVALHVDAVQIVGNLKIDLDELGVDFMTFSAHKFYGPKGIGLLYKKEAIDIENLIHGGMQERGLRAGTENVCAIIGLAEALEQSIQSLDSYTNHLSTLSTKLYHQLKSKLPQVRLNGPMIGKDRLPGILSLSFDHIRSFDLAFALDKEHIYVSTGSACNQLNILPSHVLRAIDQENISNTGTIRISFGIQNKVEDILYISDKIVECYLQNKS